MERETRVMRNNPRGGCWARELESLKASLKTDFIT